MDEKEKLKFIIFSCMVFCLPSSHSAGKGSASPFRLANDIVPSQYEALDKCLVVVEPPLSEVCEEEQCESSPDADDCTAVLHRLYLAFAQESAVAVVDYKNVTAAAWLRKSAQSVWYKDRRACSILIYKRPVRDRTCLLASPLAQPEKTKALTVESSLSFELLLQEINQECHTHRDELGQLTIEGQHREYILENLYSLKQLDNHVTAEEVFGDDSQERTTPKCEKIEISTWQEFFNSYLQHSRPFILKNAVAHWPAFSKWSNWYLREKYGNEMVHVKMSPTQDYEGVEKAELWENFGRFKIPAAVRSKLPFPDLVVPRPAPVNMAFADFLDLTEKVANQSVTNISAYLEYSSIRHYFPELEEDLDELPFVKGKLDLLHLNMWLSDGKTLGKLHFDPFDNFLCMLSGKKEVMLFEPHDNRMLYEGHIPEAEFSIDIASLKVRRRRLMDSTSMVMSPVDIKAPDYHRFPLFKSAMPLNCTISEGDALFMPAFWWHEVQSYPSPTSLRNLAVNYWYRPFLTREFPCQTCKLDVNPSYRDLL